MDQLNVQSAGQFAVGLVGQFNAFIPTDFKKSLLKLDHSPEKRPDPI